MFERDLKPRQIPTADTRFQGLTPIRHHDRPFQSPIQKLGVNAPLDVVLTNRNQTEATLGAANRALTEYYRKVHIDEPTIDELSRRMDKQASVLVTDLFSGKSDAAENARVEVVKLLQTAATVQEIPVFEPNKKR